MKRKAVITLMSLLCVLACALWLTACGFDIPDNNKETPPGGSIISPNNHVHDYGPWTREKDYHQRECSNRDYLCDRWIEEGPHIDENGDELCDVCDYNMHEHNFDYESGYCSGCGILNLNYVDYGDYYTIDGLGGAANLSDIVIPSEYDGKPVTVIQSIESDVMTSLTIPDSIEYINESKRNSFPNLTHVNYTGDIKSWCNISGIYNLLSNGEAKTLTINGTEITGELVIPNGVTSIPRGAFCNLSGLTDVTIPKSITKIGENAFSYSGLTSVTIQNGITELDGGAFSGCRELTDVTIPESLTKIGFRSFNNCSSLKNVYYGGSLESWCRINGLIELMGSDQTKTLTVDGTEITGDLIIPHGVTSIPASAFHGLNGITGISIPKSVTEIGKYAFSYCSNLTSAVIPDSVTEIGEYTFSYCSNLTSVVIPDSVTKIDNLAFLGCSSLTSAVIPDSVTKIGNYVFSGCSSLTSAVIPDSVTEIGRGIFYRCIKIKSVTLPFIGKTKDDTAQNHFGYFFGIGQSVEYDQASVPSTSMSVAITGGSFIADRAFKDCGIWEITLPESLTEIGEAAFSGCDGLVKINYTGDVASWCNISGLRELMVVGTISKTLTINGKYVAGDLVIPSGVTNIPSYAFRFCNHIDSLTLPDSLTSIGDRAFAECSSLTRIIFNGTEEQWEAVTKGTSWHTGRYDITFTGGSTSSNG